MKNKYLLLALMFITCQSIAQQLEWAKSFGGSNDEYPYAIISDNSGNVYTTGYFYGEADFDPGPDVFNIESKGGSDDAFLSILNSTGELIRASSFSCSGYAIGKDVILDDSGNIYVTGEFSDTIDVDPGLDEFNLIAAGSKDVFLLKLNSNGEFVWGKSFGGSGHNEPSAIKINSNEEILITGYFTNTTDFDPDPINSFELTSSGDQDVFIQKLDQNGNFLWAKSIGGDDWDGVNSIALDSDENILLTGFFTNEVDFDPGLGEFNLTSNGQNDIFILKLSSEGNLVWVKSIGGTGYDRGNSIAIDEENNVYVCGYFSNSIEIISGASTLSLNSNGGRDVLVMKYHTSGTFIWARSFGSTNTDWGQSIAIDPLNNVMVTGNYRNTIDLDPGDGTNEITSQGEADIFLINLNASGLYQWGTSFGGDDGDYVYGLDLDYLGNIYITGTFINTSNFDFSPSTHNLSSNGGDDVFIQKISPEYAGVDHLEIKEFKLYPNPSKGQVNIDLSQFTKLTELTIYDSYGQLVYFKELSNSEDIIELTTDFPPGIYFVNLATIQNQFQQKLIIQ